LATRDRRLGGGGRNLVAVALDSWKPTIGTRRTGERNTFPRVVFSGNRLETIANPPPRRTWSFPAPFGTQEVVGFVFSEIITIFIICACPRSRLHESRARS
jgi:hypothetical protein